MIAGLVRDTVTEGGVSGQLKGGTCAVTGRLPTLPSFFLYAGVRRSDNRHVCMARMVWLGAGHGGLPAALASSPHRVSKKNTCAKEGAMVFPEASQVDLELRAHSNALMRVTNSNSN